MSYFPRSFARAAVITLAAATLSLPVASGAASAAPVDDSIATAAVRAPALTAAAKAQLGKARRSVCVNAHIQNIGWQGWRCSRNGSPVSVGTTGQSLRMEALSISTRGTGGVCAQAHVQNVGWQPAQCGGRNQTITVGTVGQSLRMEGLRLRTGTGICARAHVENIGWQRWDCARMSRQIMVGTTGQSLRLEALNVRV
jgi:uncharacterized protein YjdB